MTEKSSIESLMDNDMLQKRSGFTKKKKVNVPKNASGDRQ